MFRSKLTLEQYQNSLQNEAPARDAYGDDLDNLEDDEDILDDVCNNNSQELSAFHYDLVQIPDDFKDDEEVLVIDSEGNVRKLRERITVTVIQGLDTYSRVVLPMNKLFQPVKKAGSVFNRFLVDLVKRPRMCPLNYKEWRLVPQVLKVDIMSYINSKYLLPPSEVVESKVLSSVVAKLKGYKRSLRMKYITANSTEAQLCALPAPEEANGEGLTHPRGISKTEWCGFISICFSKKFKEFSTNGRTARELQLGPHTNGSQSFAILREKERIEGREFGAIEWFQETRVTKEDDSFQMVETTQLVEKEKTIIKKKTGYSEDSFSDSTKKAEEYAYRKLMGVQTKGKVSGMGHGVNAKDLCYMQHRGESPLLMKVLKELQEVKQELHWRQSPHASSVGSPYTSRHNSPLEDVLLENECNEGIKHDKLDDLDGSDQGSRHDTPPSEHLVLNGSLNSGDAISMSNFSGNQSQTQRGAIISKKINQMQGDQPKQIGNQVRGGSAPKKVIQMQGDPPRQLGKQVPSPKPPHGKIITSCSVNHGGQLKQPTNKQSRLKPTNDKSLGASRHKSPLEDISIENDCNEGMEQHKLDALHVGDGSHQGSRHDTPLPEHFTGHGSPNSGDALSMSNALGNQFQRSGSTTKKGIQMQGDRPRQLENQVFRIKLINGKSMGDSLKHGNEGSNLVGLKRKEMSTNGGALEPNNKIRKQNMDQLEKLPRIAVELIIERELRKHQREISQYRSSSRRDCILFYLAGKVMKEATDKAEPNILHEILKQKLTAAAIIS